MPWRGAEPDVPIGPERRRITPQRREHAIGTADVPGLEAAGINAGFARQEQRAGEMEALRYDDQPLLAEHRLGPQHRIERAQPGEIAVDRLRRNAALDQAG